MKLSFIQASIYGNPALKCSKIFGIVEKEADIVVAKNDSPFSKEQNQNLISFSSMGRRFVFRQRKTEYRTDIFLRFKPQSPLIFFKKITAQQQS